MKKLIALLMVSVILVMSLTGCGKKESADYCNVDKRISALEKKINDFDVSYLMDHVYKESIDTDNEAVAAAAFIGSTIFEGAGTIVKTVSGMIMDVLESTDITSRKDLEKYAKDLKKSALKNFSYKITDYKVIQDANTGMDGSVVVLVNHKVAISNFDYDGSIYLEFIYQDDDWKFRIIPEKMVHAGA